jgi:hypothetical protein
VGAVNADGHGLPVLGEVAAAVATSVPLGAGGVGTILSAVGLAFDCAGPDVGALVEATALGCVCGVVGWGSDLLQASWIEPSPRAPNGTSQTAFDGLKERPRVGMRPLSNRDA